MEKGIKTVERNEIIREKLDEAKSERQGGKRVSRADFLFQFQSMNAIHVLF